MRSQRGSVELLLVGCVVIVLLGALGWVLWQRVQSNDTDTVSSQAHSRQKLSPRPDSEIVDTSDPTFKKYINHKIGFEFLFPSEAYEPTQCGEVTWGYDNYGNKVKTEPHYTVTESGRTPITVVEVGNSFVVVPQKAPIFSDTVTLSDGNQVYGACDVETINAASIKKANASGVEMRAWYVAKVDSQDEVNRLAPRAYENADFSPGSNSRKYQTTFGKLTAGRQTVVIAPVSNQLVGGFKYNAWYYPAKHRFAYFASGQSVSFQADEDASAFYGEKILDSFHLE